MMTTLAGSLGSTAGAAARDFPLKAPRAPETVPALDAREGDFEPADLEVLAGAPLEAVDLEVQCLQHLNRCLLFGGDLVLSGSKDGFRLFGTAFENPVDIGGFCCDDHLD